MRTIVVRYSEIGSKSDHVRGSMVKVLRQRIEDKLEYDGTEYGKVRTAEARIIVEDIDAKKHAESLSMIPGVSSVSPAFLADTYMEDIKHKADLVEVGDTFGVDANRSGEHEFNSQELAVELGSFIQERNDVEVDLDEPDTWINVDLRSNESFIYEKTLEGPDGFPVGTNGSLAALVSGGIDSPVAAYRTMVRGSDIVPIYFYNKPVSAEDHLMRFEAVIKRLKSLHPGKKWPYYVIDMESVNKELMSVGRGRMLLHRSLMFEVSERLAEKEGLSGIVTGEAMGQKSSQTVENLELTSSIDKPIHRPVLTEDKYSITSQARELGTYEEAKIASACSNLASKDPATSMQAQEFSDLKEEVGYDSLVQEALESAEKRFL